MPSRDNPLNPSIQNAAIPKLPTKTVRLINAGVVMAAWTSVDWNAMVDEMLDEDVTAGLH